MTPQELKSSILQLAVQGRLVEQRPEEGTAKILLESIKTSDNVNGHRVKEKNISEISDDEIVFDIPDSWEWIKLGNTCTIARGGSPRPIKEYLTTEDDGVNWIKIGDTEKNGKYISSTAEKIKPSGVSKSRMVHAGDFLLTNSMSFGRPYILKIDGCIHDGWLVISQSSEVYDQDYLYWLLSSGYAYSQFCGRVSGAVVKNLNSDKVANSVFPLPPLAEQKRIVAKIEELLPLIDRYEQAWTKLEAFNKRFPDDMQKSVLQMAIQGKLVEQRPEEGTGEELYKQIQTEKQKLIKEGKIKKGKPLPEITEDEIPFDIPESWKWIRFYEVCNYISTGPFGSMLHKSDYVSSGIPLVNPANIISEHIFPSEKMMVSQQTAERLSSYILSVGSIVMGRRGEMGRCALVTDVENGWLCGTGSFFMGPSSLVFGTYLIKFFSSVYAKQYLCGESVGTTMNNLNHSILKKLPVPLPPLAEQKRIVQKLNEILPLCDKLK
ncbi:restriction endonuclease subunit S [uncultured Ruminococcus sp.]|uniref:restriction endonuclease subunit S n=1 Tax=uncultured Ruminococcus sp. TaxID=165186 RepID=UPI0029318FBC|nr:restriction endonuclease subunit S [uncultured Ruminococcus sp.]